MTPNLATVTVWTVGHSTLPVATFLDLLGSQEIAVVADVRRYPASRRHPQYNRDALTASLAGRGIDYAPFLELGGRRVPRPDSPNTAWRNVAFRGYADYMDTPAFLAAIHRLVARAAQARTTVMCAEALWWRCHRALIADYLRARGAVVWHIGSSGDVIEHPFTSAARIVDGRLSYAGEPTLGL